METEVRKDAGEHKVRAVFYGESGGLLGKETGEIVIITCSGRLEKGDKIVILDADLEDRGEDKTDREEREMGDPSFYCGDPDAGCQEGELRGQLED